jgi:hypothetical protein
VLPSKCYERLPDRVSRSTGNLRHKRHSVRHAGPDTRPLTRGQYRCHRAHRADHYRHIHGDRLPAQPAQLRPIQNSSCDSRTNRHRQRGSGPINPAPTCTRARGRDSQRSAPARAKRRPHAASASSQRRQPRHRTCNRARAETEERQRISHQPFDHTAKPAWSCSPSAACRRPTSRRRVNGYPRGKETGYEKASGTSPLAVQVRCHGLGGRSPSSRTMQHPLDHQHRRGLSGRRAGQFRVSDPRVSRSRRRCRVWLPRSRLWRRPRRAV